MSTIITTSSHKPYYSLIDGLRFFAAFWVMNFHYLIPVGMMNELSWYRYGNLGVQLFFIISGFVIVQSLQGKTFKEFAFGRFIRLFPIFWILCTFTYILTLLVPHTDHVSFNSYLINMTMLPDIFIGYFHRGSLIDAAYWTLTVELLFYVGIGLFCTIFSYKNIRYFLGLWLVMSMITFALHIDTNFYVKLFLVRHASYFTFGSALALIVTKQATTLYEKYFDKALLVLAAIYSVTIHTRAMDPYLNPNRLDNTIVSGLLISFFIITPLLVYLSRFVKKPKVLHLLSVVGGITYPLYLLHQRTGNVAINYFTKILDINWNLFAIGCEVVIIIFAYLLYTQDKKIRTWLKKRFDRVVS